MSPLFGAQNDKRERAASSAETYSYVRRGNFRKIHLTFKIKRLLI
jgi:hypothetical protein